MRTLLLLLAAASLEAVTIPTAHVDNGRTGANTQETVLTPSNVAGVQNLGSYATDGFVYAQPLYVPNLTVSGATHACLIVATMHNTVSCFDAARPGTAALWSVSLGTSFPLGSTPQGNLLYGTEVGTASTPVADPANNLLYVVRDTTGPTWTLYKLNLSTGATISSVNITHAGFDPQQQLQRAALTLANGQVYICFGSYSDSSPWFGWIFAYDASALTQTAFFKTHTTNGAGLWGASGGPSVDGSGSLYILTGNATWDGTTDWGESILKWDANLNLTDWFTPSNWSTLNTNDSDLSSGRAMLVPGTNILVSCAKDYRVYVLDRTDMGHLQGGGGTAPQLFPTDPAGVISVHSGCYGGTYINDQVFFPNTAGKIYGFARTGATFNTTPITSSASYEFPGATLSSSSNGAADTIIWATTVASSAIFGVQPLTLRAFDNTLTELYSNAPGANLSKFVAPVVADGHVYVATQSNLVYVYGIPAPASPYSFHRKITIDHTKVPNTDRVNFPVLVSGTYSYLATVANGGKVQSAFGDDITYKTDPGCSAPLNYERETWKDTTGKINYWVNLPLVSHTVDTDFYECYGNSSVSGFQGGASSLTWNGSYDGVFHFADGTTLSGADSTARQNLSLHSTVAIAGQIDGGAATTATHYLDNTIGTVYPGSAAGPCISIWLKTTQTANTSVLSYGTDSGNDQYYLYFQQSSGSDYRVGLGKGSGSVVISDAQANDGGWHYFVGSLDTGTLPQTGRIFMDGTQRAASSFSNWVIDTTHALTIGRLAGATQTLVGTVDEARISHGSCSADQVAAEFNNQSSPSTFYTVGAEVGAAAASAIRHSVTSR